MCRTAEHAWNIIIELRIELREAQKIRSQIIGIKIAFVATSLGFVFGGKDGPQYVLLLVPAFASIFFDFLIISYGISIKRIGYYCRTYLEPKIRKMIKWPSDEPLWEEAMGLKEMRQHFAGFGNIGLTAIVVIPTILYLMKGKPFDERYYINTGAVLILSIFLILDIVFSYFWKYAPKDKLPWPRTEGTNR
ncbi:hypothetical protein [Desulfospira joergensenii]|uniref:hypothetical protein n=1 Tax=Desulfospira joergensenii TaxID=53329 RepID=UPI0003B6D1C6|nr:hypothetical protein [Desulfospira joergensenii]